MAIEYRLGWYKKPSEHHGHPVFVKSITRIVPSPKGPDTTKQIIIGHVGILTSTWRRFLAATRRKEQRAKNNRRQQLAKAVVR